MPARVHRMLLCIRQRFLSRKYRNGYFEANESGDFSRGVRKTGIGIEIREGWNKIKSVRVVCRECYCSALVNMLLPLFVGLVEGCCSKIHITHFWKKCLIYSRNEFAIRFQSENKKGFGVVRVWCAHAWAGGHVCLFVLCVVSSPSSALAGRSKRREDVIQWATNA